MSLSTTDKIGCASLAVAIVAAIAAWLSVPGVLTRSSPGADDSSGSSAGSDVSAKQLPPSQTRVISHGFVFEFSSCVLEENYILCGVTVTNTLGKARGGVLTCRDGTTLVDSAGTPYSAAICWLGRDRGISGPIKERLSPHVGYLMIAAFKDVHPKQQKMRYLEFRFREDSTWFTRDDFTVAFHNVPVTAE